LRANGFQKTVTKLGHELAVVLDPDHQETSLEASVLAEKDHAACFLLSVGAKKGVLKVFTDDAGGRDAFGRELTALQGFQALNVPRLLFVAEPERAIMTGFIDGAPLGVNLTADNLMQKAEFLGQWFGRLAKIAPRAKIDGSWYDYLARYNGGFDRDILGSQKSLLTTTRPDHAALAHNDNALSNFILGKDKRLYGVDFEDTRMKPEGWDLVTAARALFLRFPGDLQALSNSLLRGYRLTNPDCRIVEQFDQLINVLVLANLADNT